MVRVCKVRGRVGHVVDKGNRSYWGRGWETSRIRIRNKFRVVFGREGLGGETRNQWDW